jgi:hypothetical protein
LKKTYKRPTQNKKVKKKKKEKEIKF